MWHKTDWTGNMGSDSLTLFWLFSLTCYISFTASAVLDVMIYKTQNISCQKNVREKWLMSLFSREACFFFFFSFYFFFQAWIIL